MPFFSFICVCTYVCVSLSSICDVKISYVCTYIRTCTIWQSAVNRPIYVCSYTYVRIYMLYLFAINEIVSVNLYV